MNELCNINLRELIENETGQRFTRENKMCCPFHREKTPSFSIRYNPNKGKWQWKCFGGCDISGDAIDFISRYKNISYIEAKKYLGIAPEETEREKNFKRVEESVIDYYVNKNKFEYLGLFEYVDNTNTIVYYKAKIKDPDKKNNTARYYRIDENGKLIFNKDGVMNIPYNYYKLLDGLRKQERICIVEGEKDANTLRSLGLVATSLKNLSYEEMESFSWNLFTGADILVFGDTGEAGDKYRNKIRKYLLKNSNSYKEVNLPGLKNLGDNKDVTDWIDVGHDKSDLLKAIKRSLDIKTPYELQQDFRGIYKQIPDKKNDEAYIKIYLTDFNLIEAKRMKYVDDDIEGVKLVFKSCTGETIEKTGPSTVFDDVKSFKNFLGTLDLAFKGKVDDLTDLKSWINKYWAIENEELHQGIKFIKECSEVKLITNEGMITKGGINLSIKADKKNDVMILEKEFISKDELKQLKSNLFRFANKDKSVPIIGTIINNLAIAHNEELKNKLHHLLIVGESESGKSTILSNVIATILNYPAKDIKSIGLISNFGLIRDLSTGNYTSLYDEFKPSSLDKYKIQKLSESLRNLYDKTTITRGDKSFKNKNFQLTRPIVMCGEESYPNSEKALIDRSCITYLSKRERTQEHVDAMKWIIKNEDILNKFGRSVIDVILNMSTQEYESLRDRAESKFKGLNNRPLTTAVNIAAGIEIMNVLYAKNGIKVFEDYHEYISKNIKEEVLEGGEETKSTVERMLILYNQMIEDGRAGITEVVKRQGDGLFIKTSEMINEIFDFVNKTGSAEVVPLKLKDFKKQATKSGYLIGTGKSSKPIRNGDKIIRYDIYSIDRMKELNIPAIIEPDFTEEVNIDNNGKVIGGVFDRR